MYLETSQQRTADREHLPTVDESHSNAHSTPTDDDESEEIGGPDLANKESSRKIEQKVTGKSASVKRRISTQGKRQEVQRYNDYCPSKPTLHPYR